MVNNRAIIGFIVLIILIIVGVVIVQRNTEFISRLRSIFNRTSTQTSQTTSGTDTVSSGVTPEDTVAQAGYQACSPELLSQSCTNTPETVVCGAEKVVDENNNESTRAMDYPSACSYCKLYGSSGVLKLGTTSYYPLGYTPGFCSASK